jgi:hypothetical protein
MRQHNAEIRRAVASATLIAFYEGIIEPTNRPAYSTPAQESDEQVSQEEIRWRSSADIKTAEIRCQPRYVGIDETAEHFFVPPEVIAELAPSIPHIRTESMGYRFDVQELQQWIDGIRWKSLVYGGGRNQTEGQPAN